MKLKKVDLNSIAKAKNVDELKKVLKLKKDDDYFKCFMVCLDNIIYNYNDEYEDSIFRLLELIEYDVLETSNYLEKCDKIIKFRDSFLNIYQNLYKKTRKSRACYDELKDFTDYFLKVDKNFSDEVRMSEIISYDKYDDFEKYLGFLGNILKKSSDQNLDMMDRILAYLEDETHEKLNGIMKKRDIIIKQKNFVLDKLAKKKENYQEEKESINKYTHILKKLEKLEAILNKKIDNDLNEDTNVFDYLLERLQEVIVNFSERDAEAVYKLLALLEKEVLKVKDLDYLEEANKILKLRKSIVDTIKETDKTTRKSQKKFSYLKDFANRLENLEINIAYNIKSSTILANYNVIRYIVFDLENIKYTEKLINQNPYLINAFNFNSDNNSEDILSLVIDEFLEAINSSNVSYKKICYYDKILSLLLNSKFVRTDENVRNENISKITKAYENILTSGKSTGFISGWYRKLIGMLKDSEYVSSENELNKMYNIIIPREEKLSKVSVINSVKSDDFIVTIDEDLKCNKDDSFSISKLDSGLYNLKVYISDPNKLFSINSSSMKNARNNAETIYLEDKKIDLFHPGVIQNHLSLDEGKLRNVKIYDFLFDKHDGLVNFDIQKGSMVVSKNYAYSNFNNLFNKCDTLEEEKLVDDLMSVYSIISNKGLEEMLEKEFESEMTTAEKLIATLMIYTNSKVAEFSADKGYPFIYRHYTYDTPQIDKSILEELPVLEKEKYDCFLEELGKTSNHAIYSVDSKNHDALGLGYYSHITSPNRRYADVLANLCIDNFCFDKLTDEETALFEKWLKEEVSYLNDRLEGIHNYYEGYAKNVLTRR